jgi:hypothetical protein
MILQTFIHPNNVPKKVVTLQKHAPQQQQPRALNGFSQQEIEWARDKKITPSEWRRRNNLVLNAFSKFNNKVGDTVYPSNKEDYEKWGPFIVRGICASYKDFGPDVEWNDETPMIIHLVSIKDSEKTLNATWNWVTPHNKHIMGTVQ